MCTPCCCRYRCELFDDGLGFLPESLQRPKAGECKELTLLDPPTNCGELGQACCDSGFYRANNSEGYIERRSPFCWAGGTCECAGGRVDAMLSM